MYCLNTILISNFVQQQVFFHFFVAPGKILKFNCDRSSSFADISDRPSPRSLGYSNSSSFTVFKDLMKEMSDGIIQDTTSGSELSSFDEAESPACSSAAIASTTVSVVT